MVKEAEKPICVPQYKKCENCGKNLCHHVACNTCYEECDWCYDVFCNGCLTSRGSYHYCQDCLELCSDKPISSESEKSELMARSKMEILARSKMEILARSKMEILSNSKIDLMTRARMEYHKKD